MSAKTENKETQATIGEGAIADQGTTDVNMKEKKFLVKVTANPNFCGIGAGGIQFANGQATIGEGTLVNWFKEHDGYEVKETK